MTTPLPQAAVTLRAALEERADSMSSAAQMALSFLTEQGTLETAHRDLIRVQESALAVYRTVHEQLTVKHFTAVGKPPHEEMQRIRHDLRSMLQNVLLRCEMVAEDTALPQPLHEELSNIREHARACVAAINTSRDAEPAEDVTPHLLGAIEEIPPSVDAPVPADSASAHILVADDSANSREMLGRFLTRLGHTVMHATTGREAVTCAQAEEFDLILLDLVMPELNGFQVLDALRALGLLNHTPVILISGMDTEANAIRGIELGAEDFLPRPVDLKLLRARVNAVLERQRLRERELGQYFTPKLARHLLRHPEVLAAGRRAEVTVLFCDIVGFSRVSEKLGPEETIRWVGAVLTAMSACVMAEDGVLVDYTGDQIMALWGAPHPQEDHANRACRCAAGMLDALPALDECWREVVGQNTEVTIGINTGEAFVGNIGTPQKFKFGALGNTVNLASRVQSATKYVRARAIFTGSTKARLQDPVPSRRLGKVRVNNIAAPVELHELRAADDHSMQELTVSYESALASYERRELHATSALLGRMLVEFPQDGPSLLLMSRAVQEMLRNDSTAFDPVWTLPGK